MLLDQRILQHEGFDLIANNRPFDRLSGLHHLPSARMEPIGPLEVIAQAMTQARRLSDIDDTPMSILELVRTRLIRDRP